MLTRERPRTSIDLPCPVPLPSLRTAFSRRAAIFGAVVATGALAGAGARAVVSARLGENPTADAALVAWAAELPAIDTALSGLFATAPDIEADARIDALSTRWCAVTDGIRCTPARGQAGVAAKARAVAHLAAQDDTEVATPIAASLAADVLRLAEGLA